MKLIYTAFILLLAWSCAQTVNSENESPGTQTEEVDLSEKFGADEYGMKQYVMAFLKAGPNRNQDSLTAANIQKAHLENIERMAKDGDLVLAGPFLDDNEVRGIYVFNVTTIEEARELTNTDPAVKAGRLIMELRPWYGSAALMGLNELHTQMETRNPSDGN